MYISIYTSLQELKYKRWILYSPKYISCLLLFRFRHLYIYLRLKSFSVGGALLDLLGALSGPQTTRRKLCLHFILYLATPLVVLFTIFIHLKQMCFFLNNKRHEIYFYFIMETIQKSKLLIYFC
jgi:hypothetical protein